jgi:RNA polymerase sigma-70 factor (ECF subfamily)
MTTENEFRNLVRLTIRWEVGRLQTSIELSRQHPRAHVELATFDQEYVRLLTEGDPETERHFASYFGELIRIKLRSKLRSPHLIEDIRQETFLRVLNTLRRKGGLQHPERLGAFVNTVCNNVMLESIRAESRTNPYPEEGFDPMDSRIDAETELVSEERKNLATAVLAGLPPNQKELLRMIFLEERDKEEVCRKLNVDRDYLRVLIHRAKESFRTSFRRTTAPRFREPS